MPYHTNAFHGTAVSRGFVDGHARTRGRLRIESGHGETHSATAPAACKDVQDALETAA